MKKKTTNLQPVVKPHDPRLDTIVGDAALNVPGLKNLMHNKVADEDKRLDALLTAPPADPDAIIAQAKAQRTAKQAPATPAPAPAAPAPAKAQPAPAPQPAPANPATVAAKSPVAPNPAPQPATPAPTAQPAAPAQQVAPAPAPQAQPVATPTTQTEPVKSVQSPVVVAGSKATVAIDRKEAGMNGYGYLYGTYGRGVFEVLADAIETADRGQGIHPLLEETILHLIRSYPDLRARTAEVRPSYAWKYMGKKGKLAGKIFDSEEEARHAAADFLEVGVAFKDLFVKDLFYADGEGRATDHKVPVAERDEYLRQLEFVKFKRGDSKPHSGKAKDGSTKSKDDAGQEGK